MTTETGCRRHAWWVAGFLVLGLAVGVAVPAWAQAAPPAPPRQREQVLTPEDRAAMADIYWRRIQAKLGLTDQQVTDLRALLQDRRSAARATVQALIEARRQLRTLWTQPTADPAAIQSVATQVKTLQNQLFDQRLQTRLAIRAKLTPEQWQQWMTLRQGRGRRWMHRGPAFGMG